MLKPFKKLKRENFKIAPIWEWVSDDGDNDDKSIYPDIDESYVKPSSLNEIPHVAFGQFIVAAQISLKSGELLPGVAEVTVAGDQINVTPSLVFLIDRQLQIPAVETNRLLTRYTKTTANYPTAWQLQVLIQGETEMRDGQIKDGDMKSVVQAGLEALLALKAIRK